MGLANLASARRDEKAMLEGYLAKPEN